jgi:hypothetical protein
MCEEYSLAIVLHLMAIVNNNRTVHAPCIIDSKVTGGVKALRTQEQQQSATPLQQPMV